MKDGFKVIDADRHILEPTDLYQRYLPEKFKSRVRPRRWAGDSPAQPCTLRRPRLRLKPSFA